MTENVLQIIPEIIAVGAGILVFFIFALALALPVRVKMPSGTSGHREKAESMEHEVIKPDGYIDTFANQAHEGGGSIPAILLVGIPGVILWWAIYIIYNWTPK